MNEHQSITRRQALILGAGLLAGTTVAARAQSHWSVVELFTSQGCNSCPPADAFMRELVKTPNVLGLSFNVDYWDYLGWRDTLASAEYSQRQYDYAKSRGDMDVYTPQIVVDGRSHYVGSNRGAVGAALKRSASLAPARWLPVKIEETAREIAVSVEGKADMPEATLWLMAIAPRVDVKIEKGENSGKTITYSNVVRKLVPAGMWHGDAVNVSLPKNAILGRDCKGCVALLQSGHVGPVIGAGAWGEVGGAA
jgi:hypothetical protein